TARKRIKQRYYTDEQKYFSLKLLPSMYPKWMNWLSLIGYVLIGRLSLVGAPIIPDRKDALLYYRYGLTGLRQYHEARNGPLEEGERFELHYLQNYAIWLDLDILLKSILRQRS